MKILMLSNHSSLHILIQQVLLGHDSQAQVWRTHTLASALPYLRQEPQIEMVLLDITLCGWSRLATLVTTIKPCLGERKLALLIDHPADLAQVRSLGVSVDLCLPKTGGVADIVARLVGTTLADSGSAALHPDGWPSLDALAHPPGRLSGFMQLAW